MSTQNMSLRTNLISYWRLDGNSNDATATANNGTDTDITYSAGNGKIVKGAGFNGTTSKIVIADATSLKPTGNFSIASWFKQTTSNGSNIFQSYAAASGVTAGIMIGTYGVTGIPFVISAKNTGSTYNTDLKEVDGSAGINDGNWHFIVATWDGTNLNLYVDKNRTYSAWANAPVYQATNYVRIGTYCPAGSETYYWNGAIDEVGIWSRALTKLEINQLYNGKAGLSYPFPLKGNSGLLTLKV